MLTVFLFSPIRRRLELPNIQQIGAVRPRLCARFNGSALRVQGEGGVDIGVVLDDACGVLFSAADVAALGEEV